MFFMTTAGARQTSLTAMSSEAVTPEKVPSAVRELHLLLLPVAADVDRSWRPRRGARPEREDGGSLTSRSALAIPSHHRQLTLSARLHQRTFSATKNKEQLALAKRAVKFIEHAYIILRRRRVLAWLRIHDDLCNAEQSYIESLTILLDCYAAPMQERGVLPAAHQEVLFCNIRLIRDFHKGLLERFRTCYNPGALANAFTDLIAFLPHYSVYINNYANALKVLSVVRQNPSFKRFSKAIILPDKISVFPDINCFLIMPLQKLARYQLFLARLQKALPARSSELARITSVLELLRQRTAEMDSMSSESPRFAAAEPRSDIPWVLRPVRKAMQRCKELVRGNVVTNVMCATAM